MSLVAYEPGSSDESESENEEISIATSNNLQNVNFNRDSAVSNLTKNSVINLPAPKKTYHSGSPPVGGSSNSLSGLFSTLPTPKTLIEDLGFESTENRSSGISKKTVKITVPPLSQLKDDCEEPLKKKIKPSPKGSGLFSLLPAPKNVSVKETKRAFVPHVLTKKQSTPPNKVDCTPKVVPNKPSVGLISYPDSGEDSDGSEKSHDFFSLTSDNQENEYAIETFDIPSTAVEDTPEACETNEDVDQPLAFVSGFRPTPWASGQSTQPGPSWQSPAEQPSTLEEPFGEDDYLAVVEEEDLQLDDEALERLCGRRAKKQQKPMEFINVKGAELLPDPKEWLIKQLSQEQPKMRSHSHKKNDGPTTQQRRKHQITYLAFQAKESELELKNQWAQNRMSRKQTQSKYGF